MTRTTGYNRQGRTISDSMRVRAFQQFIAAQKPASVFQEFDYRGFEVSGSSGRWFVKDHPSIFTSKAKTCEAVDRCLALRAEMAEAS